MARNTTVIAPQGPSAKARGNVKKPVVAPTAPAVRKDAYGNVVPDQATDPEGYSRWHAANLEAQKTDTSGRLAMEGVNKFGTQAIQNDIAARQGGATSLQTAFAGMQGTSPLANPGTTKVPTVAENLAKYSASLPAQDPNAFPLANALKNSPSLTAMNAAIKRDPATGLPVGMKSPLAGMNIDMGGGTVQNPTKVETAADNAQDALGPAPRVDQGLADRRLGEYQEALGMSREVIDRLLNGPSTADRIGSQTLRSQLALARSAAGGPGAVAAAFRQAQQQAPELQAQATEQARAEDLQRTTAAGNVASNFAQAALGARGQDVDIAKKNTDAGLAVKGMITQLAGTQLELDQRNQEMLGQMARDMAAMDFDWAQLSVQQQQAALDRYLQQYGIDQNVAAQIKLAHESGKMGLKDWVNAGVGVLGAAAGIGAAAAGGK
jgi:hypothetical protein